MGNDNGCAPNINTIPCNETRIYDRYITDHYTQPPIKLKKQKEAFNENCKRNAARHNLSDIAQNLIDFTENQAQYLTPADKRELKQLLLDTIAEI